jgi:Carboxypeptidase regulatory-like domain
VRTAAGSNPITYHASDLVGAAPQLGPLQYNGGHIMTMLPLGGSPAIDGGNNDLAAVMSLNIDQRGLARFVDGGSGRPYTDIGATEYNAQAPSAVQVAGRVLGAVSGNPLRSQTVTLTDMHGNSSTAFSSSLGWFVFDNLPADGVYRISVSARRGTQTITVHAFESLTNANILIPGL